MDKLETIIKSIPLIEPESSIKGMQPDFLTTTEGGSLYFGTGLTTAKAMSIGVPFDVIGMLCVAEKLRRELGLKYIFQLIADTHAKSNPFCKPEEVDAMATKMTDVCRRAAQLLRIEGIYLPIKSSEIDTKPEYLEVFQAIQTEDHEYVRREWADIEYLRRHRNLQLKLSWTIGPKVNKIGFDERLYDLRFREVMGQSMSFVYLWPGRTMDKDRPKVSPYISIPGERRILIQKGEDVAAKMREAEEAFGADSLKSVKEHLRNIVALFEELHGSVEGDSTAAKVQTIIDKVISTRLRFGL
ncbi:MAG: hypothetical protein US96_C0032G0003 [Candidatus Woesebacteria bacterium GW2011_GWB1_38_5b]|uniref:Uncharacterized protein n=1 Tax=Candidatus Woesebacteria bacterium GW2011_GWB1_38_5b TaxID=1618569 RepID=A0A0G0ML12_9BACT|nr:MAG: hypothetical protein US96_C0032G0003 [Candidatus Woesebacteria bacterium GW2011_GWB1_38_5b]